MRHTRQHHRKLVAEISVTPMLDLVFILLFAFMVALPLVSNSDALLRPAAARLESAAPAPENVLTLRVSGPDTLVADSSPAEPLTLAAAEARLREEWLPARPGLGVRVEIAPDQPVSTLAEVMAMLTRAGVQRTAFQVEEEAR